MIRNLLNAVIYYFIITMLFSRCDGVRESVDKDGVRVVGEYDWMGRKNGYFINYYPNGIVRDSIFYSKNLTHDMSYKFDSTGRKIGSIRYNHGNVVYTKTFFSNGELNRYEENLNEREKSIIQFYESGYPRLYQWGKDGYGKYLKLWDKDGFMEICSLPLQIEFGDSICMILEHSQLDSTALRSMVKLILDEDILVFRPDTVVQSDETFYFNNGKLIQLIQNRKLPTYSRMGLEVCFPRPMNKEKLKILFLEYSEDSDHYLGVSGLELDLLSNTYTTSNFWINPDAIGGFATLDMNRR